MIQINLWIDFDFVKGSLALSAIDDLPNPESLGENGVESGTQHHVPRIDLLRVAYIVQVQ